MQEADIMVGQQPYLNQYKGENMRDIATLIIGIVIVWQGYELVKRQRKMKAEFKALKKANDDLNIEFGSDKGIELVKKQYPNLELKDDIRTGLEDANKS